MEGDAKKNKTLPIIIHYLPLEVFTLQLNLNIKLFKLLMMVERNKFK